MSVEVQYDAYGKSRVRVSAIRRDGDRHEFIELACSITLTGDFDAAYTDADNSLVVPTDTIKNTVYAIARRDGIASADDFARRLGRHFCERYEQVTSVVVEVEELPWQRLVVDGADHDHSFSAAAHRYVCSVLVVDVSGEESDDGEDNLEFIQSCGITGLKVLKTTASAFTGFHTDEFTTLQPTDDRIFATTIDAEWDCPDPEVDWSTIRETICTELLRVFATHHSASVQQTLYKMGEAALAACPELDEISLTMPNQHHLLAKLEPLGFDNPNHVFVPTDEPFGRISGTIGRSQGAAE